MLIVYRKSSLGWSPIYYMVQLMAELFRADLLIFKSQSIPKNLGKRLEAHFLRRKKDQEGEPCLIICNGPNDLRLLSGIKNWRTRFGIVAAWVIDSFWINRIPKLNPVLNKFDYLLDNFDYFLITTKEDVSEWRQLTKKPIHWLPWGTDALRLGSSASRRDWNLIRVGRQPAEWDNDSMTKKLCLEKKLRFHGRPSYHSCPITNQKMLMNIFGQTQFTLAFSNTANPTKYTHPSREYLTARWVDSLACGAIVAGIPPQEPSIKSLLWDGATLNLQSVIIEEGLEVIAEAVRNWTPQKAETNYKQALKLLDWRWRFAVISDLLKVSSDQLNYEFNLLKVQAGVE